MAFSAAFAACSTDGDGSNAIATFERFQQALRRGDRAECRALLTVDSQAVLGQMPWDTVREQRPLEVLGVDRGGAEFFVRVCDPNDGDRDAQFVVVREYGRLVVDLVASAGLTAQVVEATGTRPTFESRELSAADHDRIRLHELAQPPR